MLNPPSHAHTFHLHEPCRVDMGKRKSCGSQVLVRGECLVPAFLLEASMLSARRKLCLELEMYFACTHILDAFPFAFCKNPFITSLPLSPNLLVGL